MKILNFGLIAITFSLLSSIGIDAQAQTLTVQVQETRLRTAPKQWAASVATLKYGDSIEAVKVEKDWVEGLTAGKKKGFVHSSAMSTKKVVLVGSKEANANLDSTDVISAGKGFSKATEDQYVKNNAGLDFKSVNSVESIKLSESELKSFMKEGKIGEGVK